VPNRIHFTGYSREPERIYPTFDLLVLPSDFEAFPIVFVEAAYCGVPSLRSNVEGSRDQIVEGVTGFTYPQKQGYEGMRGALSKILDQKWEELPAMGRAARAHCLQLCDMSRFAEGLEAMYRSAQA
jgi:glycosyltransferase involved in cell wall biosynthesis